jgi:hypothetical protein
MKASPASTKPSAWLGLILFLCSPALAPADTLTAAMNAVTARVLCLPSDGDPHTGPPLLKPDPWGGLSPTATPHPRRFVERHGTDRVGLTGLRPSALPPMPALARALLGVPPPLAAGVGARGQAGFRLIGLKATI